MSKLFATIIVLSAGLASPFAQAAYRAPRAVVEGRSAYAMVPPPLQRGCFVTTDRVKDIRFWDPMCSRWGSGIRPGLTENSGILEGD